ncbi:ProQ/FinO family protein [Salmonella enterica]|nr:proQ/FINO family protein [Salmonella enterica]EBQ9004520.1 proQ/FINO family protein [Salmonella enterica subsp. enterica serovar Blockley]ECS7526340.1 proQ/FINO family protein [Salmonella enterica]ECW2125706.1 proQ/FINO family protein [Salmonella enterica]
MTRQKQQQSAGEPPAGDEVEHQKPKTPHSADGKGRKFRMPGQKKPENITRIQWKNRKAVQRLSVLWPELFDLNNPKPLKLGVGKGSLKASLVSYTRSFRYLRALIAGGTRYDLNGQPCGEVTEAQQNDAREALEKARQKRLNAQNQ